MSISNIRIGMVDRYECGYMGEVLEKLSSLQGVREKEYSSWDYAELKEVKPGHFLKLFPPVLELC